MLNPTRMQRITLLVLKRDVHLLIQALISTELFQPLESSCLPDTGDQATPFHQHDLIHAYQSLELNLMSLLQGFALSAPEVTLGEADPVGDLQPIRTMVLNLAKELAALDQQRKNLQIQIRDLERYQIIHRALA